MNIKAILSGKMQIHLFEVAQQKMEDYMATKPIYTFYCKLHEVLPETWRLIQLPQNRSVAQLAYAVMTTFEMQARHLFNVTVFKDPSNKDSWRRSADDTVYTTDVDEDREVYGSSVADAVATQIDSVFAPGNREAVLNYDYGDGWKVSIVLVDIMTDPELKVRDLPRVIAGAGYGIVEDIGGTYGLYQLEDAFQNPTSGTDNDIEEKQAMREWFWLDHFDMNEFDRDEMNSRLKKIPGIYQRAYEKWKAPTAAEARLIMREN